MKTLPSVTHRPSLRHISKRTWVNLAVIAVILVACVGGYYFSSHKKPTFKQKYSPSLSSYKIPGESKGSGVSFGLPASYKKLAASRGLPANSKDAFVNIPVGIKVPIGGAYASSSAYLGNTNPSAAVLQSYNADLKTATPAFLNGQKTLAANLLKSTHFSHGTISILDLHAFSDANIKQGAWAADFSVGNSKFPPLYKGRLVYAVTGSSSYIFYVYAYDYNWDAAANQPVWAQVYNSLKIDQ